MEYIVATSEADFTAAAALFRTYAHWLKVDLCFQSFEDELNRLPEMYNTAIGGIVLCKDDVQYVGCAAIRPKKEGNCELKRMWVEEAYKGKGIGEQLLLQCIKLAKDIGYKSILLDTLEHLQPAIALYKKHGFVETTAYYNNPLKGVVYMALAL